MGAKPLVWKVREEGEGIWWVEVPATVFGPAPGMWLGTCGQERAQLYCDALNGVESAIALLRPDLVEWQSRKGWVTVG